MNIIKDTIQAFQLGDSITFENLRMFPLVDQVPLLARKRETTPYCTLDEALAAGAAKVTEVSHSGSVPDLMFLNEGDIPVLLLDGEELVGAKQNRVLNLSILAPANEAITIPVSCVEQGRWSYGFGEFRSEERIQFARGRSGKAASVTRAMASGAPPRSDQSEVWHNISRKSARLRVNSPTESMSDIYENKKRSIESAVEAFSSADQQVGAVFGIDDAVAGIDLFDSETTFAKMLPKLVRSYALDAIETPRRQWKATSVTEAQRFINSLCAVEVQKYKAIGLGEDLRLKSQMIAGGALANENQIVHLGAFLLAEDDSESLTSRRSRFMRSSHRRRPH